MTSDRHDPRQFLKRLTGLTISVTDPAAQEVSGQSVQALEGIAEGLESTPEGPHRPAADVAD